VLDDVATKMKGSPKFYFRIEGHTIAEGDRKANMDLAQVRANEVMRYLVEDKGIAAYRLKAEAAEPGQGKEVRCVALEKP
jgi:outer membrane protein OmpA-like peptidoglycan-associated protein